jgi:hypothetical protein
MQQAQAAIDAARASGADRYAPQEFAAAQGALKRAHDAVDERDYRLALNHALDSRERAQTAAKDAADRKAAARADADRALAGAVAALADARTKLKAAESGRVAPARLASARTAIADLDQAVQKARAAWARGDYLDVDGAVAPETARLRAAVRDIDTTPAQPPRRRR